MKSKRLLLCVITVLVLSLTVNCGLGLAKTRKYGSTKSRTYYYTTSKSKNVRIEKTGKKIGNKKVLKSWMFGAIELVADYALKEYTIPFSMVKSMVDQPGVKYSTKSWSSYVFQANYKTRTIFAYTNKSKTNKRTVLIDEKGTADVFYVFHPVGQGFKRSHYDKKLKSKAAMKTRYYDSKKRNLKKCDVNYNHKGKEVWRLSTELLTEKWK